MRSSPSKVPLEVLKFLRSGPLTVKELRQGMESDLSSMYRHLKQLEELGFVDKRKEPVKDRLGRVRATYVYFVHRNWVGH